MFDYGQNELSPKTRLLALAAFTLLLAVMTAGGFLLFWDSRPFYDVSATRACLTRTGFSVSNPTKDFGYFSDASNPVIALYVDGSRYPSMLFFPSVGEADSYNEGESVPYSQRGNVLFGVERGAESAKVKRLTACLRTKP
jgi:hypothetical protein